MSKIYTIAALQGLSLPELRALLASVQEELGRSEPGSEARREALANLNTVSLAIAQRMTGPRL